MPKFDVFKVLSLIQKGMTIAEKLRATKSGKERFEIAVDHADGLMQELEGVIGKDLLKDDAIKPLVDEYVAIGIKLSKTVERVKALRAAQG
jgi:hypothetical protein